MSRFFCGCFGGEARPEPEPSWGVGVSSAKAPPMATAQAANTNMQPCTKTTAKIPKNSTLTPPTKMSVHADPPPSVVREPKRVTYLTGSQLGKGGFAICHRAELCEDGKPTGKVVALKIVRSKMEPPKLAQKFVTELQLHSKLHHPNIVEFYRAFSFEQSTYVVLEICENGSLADVIRKRKYLTMPEIRRFIIQTCGAVKYLHHRNIIHRDLKTGNLFLDKGMNIKVGDFGLAAMLVSKNDIGARRTTMCGTPNYLAPEILEKGGRGHNEKVDLWAIGIIAYTLAVGKAPFHAAKREDIYKKLQSCDYEWPDISKNPNDISNDLRDLVGSLLVHEDDRPSPDQIVSHPFFKMAFIPDHLDSSCTTKKPTWNVRPPTAETIQRGYSESWMKLCRASGVGEYAPGRVFPLSNAKRVVSVVKDVEREIQAGRAPVVPIPKDTVYLPFPDRTHLLQPKELSEIVEEHESSSDHRLSEASGNARPGRLDRMLAEKYLRAERLKENMDPVEPAEPSKPAAEVKRAGSGRRKKQEESQPAKVETAKVENKVIEVQIEKPVRSRTASRTEAPEPKPTSLPRQASKQRLIEPTSAPTASSRQSSREQPLEQPALARQASRRGKQIRVDSVMLPKPASSDDTPPLPKPSTIRTISRTERVRSSRIPSREAPSKKADPVIAISSDESTPPSSSSDSTLVPFSDPASVLARASQLRDNIASALKGRHSTAKRPSRAPKLPFVSKWVDYSRKLGVGYVLTDGSIGCIMSATSRHPVTNVVARNGFAHLEDSKKDAETLSRVPLEYYECRQDGIKRVEVTAERKRSTGIVWAKFGRYMCQQLGSAERRASTEAAKAGGDGVFVRFYERLGTVGIWGFSDGCFQINFPDHTKLVISADGKSCNFTCLSVEAMAYLSENGDLPYKFIKQREVLSGSIPGLLYGMGDSGSDVVATTEANFFRDKLRYIIDVADEWIAGGGLGCSGDGFQRPQWDGPHLEDGKKQDWVTVGRHGGDAARE